MIDISSEYFHFHWYLKNDNAIINIGANTGALIKEVNIKNRIYYFFNDLIIDKNLNKNIDIFYIGYIAV